MFLINLWDIWIIYERKVSNEKRNKAGNTDSTLKARNLMDSELILTI